MGAPVIEDRWHFYFAYEQLRAEDNSTAERLSAIGALDRSMLIDAGLSPAILPAVIPSTGHWSFYLFRSDIQLNDKNHLVVRFNGNVSKVGNFNTGPLNTLDRSSDTFSKDRALAVQLASYQQRLLNEFRFQITKRDSGGVRNEKSASGPSETDSRRRTVQSA